MNRNWLVGSLVMLVSCVIEVPRDDDGAVDGSGPQVPADAVSLEVGQVASYTIGNLDDAQAYRITLVLDANVTPGPDGTGTFLDGDANGQADAGLSEEVALITTVNGEDITDAKTTPAGTDDPAAPSGVFPVDGKIVVEILGVGPGVVRPVAYENGGASTFLEIDADGVPVEPHGVGGPLTVTGEAPYGITLSPGDDQSVPVGETTTYTASGLDDGQAYRVTLVLAANLTLGSDGTATFLDGDANGQADSGTSELIANITAINGGAVTPTKTVPSGTDDPAAPSGVFPVGGEISVEIVGLAVGEVHPVVYENGGASTFLELDAGGAPIETYSVGSRLWVE